MSANYGFGGGFNSGGGGGSSTIINTTTVVTASQLDFLLLLSQSSIPTAPTGSDVSIFNMPVAGSGHPHMMLSGNVVIPLGHANHSSRIIEYTPGDAANLGTRRGWQITQLSAGGLTHPTPSSTTGRLEDTVVRSRFTSAASTGSPSGFIGTVASLWRGNATGAGGFFYFARWSTATPNTANTQMFCGMAGSYPSVQPSLIPNSVAMSWDETDGVNGNVFITCRNTVTGTRVAIPGSQRDTSLWDLYIQCQSSGSTIFVTTVNLSSGTRFDTSFDTTFIPSGTTFMNPGLTRNTGTSTTAQSIDIARLWIRSGT